MDEEAILGGLRSGEDLPDYDYEEFKAGSAGQDRRGDDPGRDTPQSRGRYTDDGDDRIFRQATDDEQGRGARPDRSGSDSVYFISRDVAIVTDLWCLAQVCGSVAPRMSVAGSPRRSPGERDIGPGQIGGVRPCGSSSIKVAGTCLLVLGFPFWLLFSGVGKPDLWDRGLVCCWGTFLCGLFTPTNPLPGHRFVPESHIYI